MLRPHGLGYDTPALRALGIALSPEGATYHSPGREAWAYVKQKIESCKDDMYL
jgi:hypothetical protein